MLKVLITEWLSKPSADSNLAMDFILELNRDFTSLRRSNVAMAYFEDLEMYGLRPKHDPVETLYICNLDEQKLKRYHYIIQIHTG